MLTLFSIWTTLLALLMIIFYGLPFKCVISNSGSFCSDNV